MKPIHTTIPSSLDAVDRLVSDIMADCQSTLTAKPLFALELVLREVLNNGAIHGNGLDPSKRVSLDLWAEDGLLHIQVGDEGPGFPWQSVLQAPQALDEERGRGFPILKSYCSSIRFNAPGNQLSLTIPLKPS